MKNILAFDAETNGLWGQVFAIGATLIDTKGNEIARFYGAIECPDPIEWVAKNVVPHCEATHDSYSELIEDFSTWYMENKKDAYVVAHMGYIVEAHLLREMHRLGGIGDWDGPFPMHDTASLLLAAGEDPTSEDAYLEKYDIPAYTPAHNPLADARNTATVFARLVR